MEPKRAFQQLLELMVKAVVDEPLLVNVIINQGVQTCVYEIRVAKSDVGKVLGKKGSMVDAFRKILMAFSTKHKFRAVIEVLE